MSRHTTCIHWYWMLDHLWGQAYKAPRCKLVEQLISATAFSTKRILGSKWLNIADLQAHNVSICEKCSSLSLSSYFKIILQLQSDSSILFLLSCQLHVTLLMYNIDHITSHLCLNIWWGYSMDTIYDVSIIPSHCIRQDMLLIQRTDFSSVINKVRSDLCVPGQSNMSII